MSQIRNKQRNRATRSGDVSISDVAMAAGVSTASVSRCINAPDRVSAAIRERVTKAISDLHYIPHRVGRALASQRSRTIGAVVPTLENAIFARHVMSFQKCLTKAGYTLLLATAEYDPEMEFKQVRVMLEHGVDALMLVGQKRKREFYEMLARTKIPFINTWRFDNKSPYPSCGFDHEKALGRVVDYLTELGHERIGVITGFPKINDRVEARLVGIRKGLKRHGLVLDDSMIVSSGYTFDAGAKSLEKLLINEHPPTAIICGNDVLAVGALREAQRRGIKVPEKLSIIGFGDLDIAAQIDPPLTTIRTPKHEIGEASARYLLDILAGRETKRHIELDIRFCERGSVGPVPGG